MDHTKSISYKGALHWYTLIARIFLGTLFLWAGFSKMPQPENFARTIDAFQLLPSMLILPAAIAIPWIEILTGLSLVIGFQTRSSIYVGLCLLCLFIIVLAVNIFRGINNVPCGCFGSNLDNSLSMIITRNVLIISLCLPLIRNHKHRWSIDHLIRSERSTLENQETM